MENYKNDSINPGDGNLEISEIMEMNNVTKGELDRLVYMIQTQESLRELITHEYADVNKRVIEPYKIVDLQKVLNQKWTMKISETGIFTTETFMAIVAFQKENWYSASWMIQVDMKNWLFENYTKSNQKEEDSNEDYEDFMEGITGNKSDKLEKPEKEMKPEKDENYEDFMKSFDIPNIIKSKELKASKVEKGSIENIENNKYKRGNELLKDSEFSSKLSQVAANIWCNVSDLITVMRAESRTPDNPEWIDSKAVNPNGWATGLIQFMPKTAIWLWTTTENLMKMSALDQLDYVQMYFEQNSRGYKLNNVADLYRVVFFPISLGKPENWVFESNELSAGLIARKNPAIARFGPGHYIDNKIFEKYVSSYVS